MLHQHGGEMSEVDRLAYQWRISRKHLLDLAIHHLTIDPIDPETQKEPELNEVGMRMECDPSLSCP